MKIKFEDQSYIEINKNNNKITIIISAKDQYNINKKIVNAVEITEDQLKKLLSDIQE